MENVITNRFALSALALAIGSIGAVGFGPGAIAAEMSDELRELTQPVSQIELGIGRVSRDSFRFGQFNGLSEKGLFGHADIDFVRRGEDARYLEIFGTSLGLDDMRRLSIRGGIQGNFGLRFNYHELGRKQDDSYQTPYLGAGSDQLTRPATLARAATTTAMNAGGALASHMQSFDIKTRRSSYELAFSKEISSAWGLDANYKQERKEGSKLTGAVMQIGGGGSRGIVIVPEPIDYVTDQIDLSARYANGPFQAQVGYYASLFTNDNRGLTFDNLYTGSGNATGRLGLPPDNEFHQISASAAYAFGSTSRLSGALSFGRMTQNETFLPYSTGGLMPSWDSLRGEVLTTHANLKFSTKLTKQLGFSAGYKYDERDNNTPVRQFNYLTADRDASTGDALQRRNAPLSSVKQAAHAEFDYHLTPQTVFKAGYDYHHVKHTHEPTDWDEEHALKLEARTRFGESVTTGAKYGRAERRASSYDGAAPLTDTYSSAYLASLVTGGTTGRTYPWLEVPGLRKYFLADRDRESIKAYVNFLPTERIDMQLSADYFYDEYPDTTIGLTRANGWAANAEMNVMVSEALTVRSFASLDQYATGQRGANNTSNAQLREAEQGTIPADRLWKISLRDRTFTFGLGLNFRPNEKYELGGDFTHSFSRNRASVSAGSSVTVQDFPDVIGRLNRLDLYGRYWLRKDLSLNVNYVQERYTSTDWAIDPPLALTSSSALVGTNQTSPDYKVHVLLLSATYKFQ